VNRKVFLARPRLDCSFKPGPVPAEKGAPQTDILRDFGKFIDGVISYHRNNGDAVISETRALWQFSLEEMQHVASQHDIVYFPHRVQQQFPIGPNALFYKNAALLDHFTIDPAGWGASLSFLPPEPVPGGRRVDIAALRAPLASNRSIFEQPSPAAAPIDAPYLLFLCQLPHDETIKLHSDVTVEQALDAVIRYAERAGARLIVKGHPANPRSMAPLQQRTEASDAALWVDDQSIHSCLKGAERVFLVNSGAGIETILHDRTLLRFGRAEYDSVVPLVAPTPEAIAGAADYRHDSRAYENFITTFAQNCVYLPDQNSFGPIIERAVSQLPSPAKSETASSSSRQHIITSGLPGSGAGLVHIIFQNEKFPDVKFVADFRPAVAASSSRNIVTCHPNDVFNVDAVLAAADKEGKRTRFVLTVKDPRRALLERDPNFPRHRAFDADHGLQFGDGSASLTAAGVGTHGMAVNALLMRDGINALIVRHEDLITNPDEERKRISGLTGWRSAKVLAANPLFAPLATAPAWQPPTGADAARLVRQFRLMPGLADLVTRWGYASDGRWLDELAASQAATRITGTICAFHTDDALYAGEAARMMASADALGLRIDMTVLPHGGDWLANVRMKPRLLQDARRRLAGPILYVDVDAIFHADPWIRLDVVETDVAFATYRDGRVRSGTVYIADTVGGRRFLDDWAARLEADATAWDQHPIDTILRDYRDGGGDYSISLLPVSLCHVFDRDGASTPATAPIIEHLQASRELKERSAKIVAGLDRRRRRLAELDRIG